MTEQKPPEQPVLTTQGTLPATINQILAEHLQARLRSDQSFTLEEIATVQSMPHRFIESSANLSQAECERLRELAILSRCGLRFITPISSHRKFIGPIIVAGKKLLWRLIHSQLRKQFDAMEEFNGAMVENLAREISRNSRLKTHQQV